MAKMALVHHATCGPIIRLDNVKSPRLRVSGLPSGSKLIVATYAASGAISIAVIDTNGEHPCHCGDWLQVQYQGQKPHKTICSIINKAA